MAYAANGRISRDPFEGALAITDEQYSQALEGILAGMIVSIDGGFSVSPLPDPVPPPEVEQDVAQRIAATRYGHEVGGTTVEGMRIDTSRDSQQLVTGAALAALMDSSYSCNFKTANGYVLLGAELLKAVASAVRAHVQGCFDREAELLAAVADGSFVESMVDQGWP